VAEHDHSGDYGYDMLDEVRAAPAASARRAARRPIVGSHGIGREIDPDGDFGYDHAHDV
jgi:hypothetical protein